MLAYNEDNQDNKKERIHMKQLHKSTSNRVLAGVLGGFAERYGIDPTVLRVIYAAVTIITATVPLVLLYLAAALIMPD